jgi:hypothetical protein
VNTFRMFDARTNLGRSEKFGPGGRLKASPLRSIPTSREDLSKAGGKSNSASLISQCLALAGGLQRG